jgi:Ala-tRNA(Pro) deacylase
MKERAMNVQKFLQKRGLQFTAMPHQPTFDAQSLALAVQVPGQEVAKSVLLRCGREYVLALLPATHTVDLHAVKDLLGCAHVALATEAECGSHFADCELGALPPFGSEYGMRTIMDDSLARDVEIVFEGNSHREAIRMRTDDFRGLEQPLVGAFCHPW